MSCILVAVVVDVLPSSLVEHVLSLECEGCNTDGLVNEGEIV